MNFDRYKYDLYFADFCITYFKRLKFKVFMNKHDDKYMR